MSSPSQACVCPARWLPEGRALQQLLDKGYADKYRAEGPVHLIGVEFSRDCRNIVGFETRALDF